MKTVFISVLVCLLSFVAACFSITKEPGLQFDFFIASSVVCIVSLFIFFWNFL